MDSIKLLEELVLINSVFPNEQKIAEFIEMMLIENCFDVVRQEIAPGRFNLLAQRGKTGRPILLYGHLDTVPAYGYDAAGKDPLKMEERDGRLRGLGVYDMKAGVAAILKAVEECENDRAIKLLFACDEEADSKGCYAVTKTNFLKDVDFVISTEMSDVSDISEKTRMITIGRRGRAQYEITVPGKSAHAARMNEGVSAITEASKLAIEIEKMNVELPQHPQLSHGDQFVRRIFSESVSLSLPNTATLLVDRHLVTPENAESARQHIEAKINELYANGTLRETDGKHAAIRIKPREVPYLMPYVLDQNNVYVQKLSSAVEQTLGVPARYNCGLTVADENLIAMQGVPIVTLGPIGGREHSSEEWVSKSSYLELIEVLKTFLRSC